MELRPGSCEIVVQLRDAAVAAIPPDAGSFSVSPSTEPFVLVQGARPVSAVRMREEDVGAALLVVALDSENTLLELRPQFLLSLRIEFRSVLAVGFTPDVFQGIFVVVVRLVQFLRPFGGEFVERLVEFIPGKLLADEGRGRGQQGKKGT